MRIFRPRVAALAAAIAAFNGSVAGIAPAAHAASTAQAGAVKFVKRTDSSFDRFTSNPTPEFEAWMNSKFWRAEVFSPYFDNKTSWYAHGWAYRDLYALYRGSGYAAAHSNWILRDAAGNPLYIPWGCSGGSCPQYAADVGNPEFRASWIASAKAELEKGYAGLWIDDVNLDFRVGNGAGQFVAPVDPRTAQPMSQQAWREYMATFVEEIRRALPGVELVHNSIWYAGGGERDRNPFVRREIASADYINIERGVNDPGLTGGEGEWSLRALLGFIDRVHASGRGVILDGGDSTPEGREYSLASYFEISTGNDGVGLGSMTPENWWSGFDIDLGEALGPRTVWQGVLRRDFTRGVTLVNEPQAPTRTVALPAPLLTASGATVASVTLGAGAGAVLRYASAITYGAPAAVGGPLLRAVASSKPRHARCARRAHRAHRASRCRLRHRGITLRVLTQVRRHRVELFVSGRLRPARSGLVAVRAKRRRRGGWVTVRVLRSRVKGGRFAATFTGLRPGDYRVSAAYLGA
jgi:hypothetical protein